MTINKTLQSTVSIKQKLSGDSFFNNSILFTRSNMQIFKYLLQNLV
ncbi:hypothetical protein LEP1GSC024_2362 [Leptospira noguchii str. 2001034031]|uniref:Uncharacterized protein n=1 Tax=Leptospira noguchii str. 2001034031 TaxID=1193053 RepID=M6YBD1_9LEPT|nr:hypothetical protein LEP1GSC024_2362 [Leptospira noguchii str. 2001034031]